MLERDYKELMEQVEPGAALKNRVMDQLTGAGADDRRPHPVGRRVAAVALSMVLVLALSVSALAAGVPGFRAWLFGPESGVAGQLTPVSAVGNNEGLTMEVLGAMGDKNNVVVYFTLQDTAMQNRLSSHMTVSVSAKLNDEYPPQENVYEGGREFIAPEVVEYDEETQTALIKYHMVTGKTEEGVIDHGDGTGSVIWSEEPYDATGATVTMRVKKIIVEDDAVIAEPLELSGIAVTQETLEVSGVQTITETTGEDPLKLEFRKWRILSVEDMETENAEYIEEYEAAGGETITPMFEGFREGDGTPRVLKPGTGIAVAGRENARITAMGFLDGKLHIQYLYQGYLTDSDNQAMFVFPAAAGAVFEEAPTPEEQRYRYLNSMSFYLRDDGTAVGGEPLSESDRETVWYREDVFEIGPEELEEYDFFASVYESTDRWVNFTAEPFVLEESLPESVTTLH